MSQTLRFSLLLDENTQTASNNAVLQHLPAPLGHHASLARKLNILQGEVFSVVSYLSVQLQLLCLWWILCTLYLHACQVKVTVSDSGLCCCTCVTYFERELTPLSVYLKINKCIFLFQKTNVFRGWGVRGRGYLFLIYMGPDQSRVLGMRIV